MKKAPLVIGWIEHVSLPELSLPNIRAKIDTGARTSALHATEITPFQKDGELWVRFVAQLHDEAPNVRVETPIYDIRHIKNTGGIPEERIVIRAALHIAGQSWPISVSLTDRSKMRFPMIVGRTALKKHNIAVHTHRTNLTAN
ncbi:ATP-dependent zinc protease [Falsihalocynthiibacter arcticus]|nr:RimK/LysX family protein [Falsihalocynthiibacter arcticus]